MAGGDNTKQIVFDDWSGGDWGAFDRVEVARRNLPMFRIRNMQVYLNGSLGPRPGLRELDLTWSTNFGAGTEGNGTAAMWTTHVGALFQAVDASTITGVAGTYAVTFEVNPFTAKVPAQLTVTAYPAAGTGATAHPVGDSWLFQGKDQLSDDCTTRDFVLTHPGLSSQPNMSIVFRDRIYAWNSASTTESNLVNYTDAATTTFQTNNTFRVGPDGSAIRDALILGNSLHFMVAEGDNNVRFYALTGASPETGSLQPVAGSELPSAGPNFSRVATSTQLYFFSGGIGGLTTYDSQELDKKFNYLRPVPDAIEFEEILLQGGQAFQHGTAYGRENDSVIIGTILIDVDVADGYENRTLEIVNNTPTYGLYAGLYDELDAITNVGDNKLLFKFMKSGQYPQYFVRDITLNRPAKNNDIWSTSIEEMANTYANESAVKGVVDFPDIRAPEGSLVRIRRVIIELDYWKSETTSSVTGYQDPAISMKHIARRTTDGVDVETDDGAFSTTSWADSDPDATPSDIPNSRTIVYEPSLTDFASAFQLILYDMESIALQRVIVEAEYTPFLPTGR